VVGQRHPQSIGSNAGKGGFAAIVVVGYSKGSNASTSNRVYTVGMLWLVVLIVFNLRGTAVVTSLAIANACIVIEDFNIVVL
jgi:hypothetical protein